jgi:hypothetical protein
MTAVIAAELALLALDALFFLIVFGLPSRTEDVVMARHIVAFTAMTGVEAGLLLAAMFGVHVSVLAFVALFGAQDVLIGQRIWYVIRARRRRR